MKINHIHKTSLTLGLALWMAITPALAAQQLSVQTPLLGPSDVLVTDDGTVYVSDSKNNTIVNVTDGTVLAGYTLPDTVYEVPTGGYADGDALDALFSHPTTLVEWMDGIVVSDTQNHVLRLVKDGSVMTLAGTGEAGTSNGTGIEASFNLPRGLAVDDDDNLYVADSGNGRIQIITTSGVVSTYYSGLEAPCGLDWYDGALYITDALTHEILKLEDGTLTVIAGVSVADEDAWIGGFSDGPVDQATFQSPQDIVVTDDGIFIADTGNSAIRVIRNDRVSTLISHDLDNNGTWPTMPSGLAVADGVLYGADPFAGVVFTEDASTPTFADGNSDDWWVPSATILADASIMVGVGNDYFAPYNTLTRGMMAAVLQNYAQSRDRSAILVGDASFTDVSEDLWCGDAIGWLSTQGITQGYEDGTFGVYQSVSRQNLAVFLFRYAQTLGIDTSARTSLEGFADSDSVGTYAQEALEWAVAVGVMQGTTEGYLLPTASITRAQAAVMLCNWMVAVDG